MIVTCPNCQTRYNLPDDKIPAGGAMVKCSKCSHVFKAELPATPEEEVENLLDEETQAAADPQAEDEFEETFDEVAAGGDKSADDAPAEEGQAEEGPAGEEAPSAPEESIPEESVPEEPVSEDAAPEEAPEATADETPEAGPDEDTSIEDALGDLFADDEPAADEAPGDDLFAEDDTPAEADAPAEDDTPAESDTPAEAEEDGVDDLFADEETADADMPGMDDLFDDSDTAPAPEEGPKPSAPDQDDGPGDSLFEENDLFADDDEDEEEAEPGDLFDDDDDDDAEDTSDLFADDDEDEEDGLTSDKDDILDFEEAAPKKKGTKALGCLVAIVVFALLLGVGIYFKAWTLLGIDLGGYLQNVPYIGKMFMEEGAEDQEAAPGESPADKVRKIELKNVKQYYVANEKTGNLFVVEGKAVNMFAEPKERIKVEVVLYDGQEQVLTSQSFLCGNVLSQFQLQVQSKKEIQDGLSSEVGILSNNTFLRPGSSTPFMAVFFEPPAEVRTFLVKVLDVGSPE